MRYFLHLLPAILPMFFWVGYHYYKDRHLPEPAGNLLLTFVLGIGSAYLATLLYMSLDFIDLRFDAFLLAETNPMGMFVYAVLGIGVIEELAKMIPFLLIIMHFKEFNEPIDGIIYASFIAIGFAAVENIQYIRAMTDTAAWARGFAGPVVHIVFASIWGYMIGRAWLCRRRVGQTIIAALALTALLHGIYDFIAIAMPAPMLPVAAALIAGIWIWRLLLIKDLHSLPPEPCPAELETGD